MNHTKDYIDFVVNSHLYEKFFLNHYIDKLYSNPYTIEKIVISYTTSPNIAQNSPFSIYGHLLLLEQTTNQKTTNHLSQKHINEFNLKKDSYIGSSNTLRNKTMMEFLSKLINIYQDNITYLRAFMEIQELEGRNFTIGLVNLDCFEVLFSDFEKWASIPDTHKYGCSITIVNSYNSKLINEVFLSHLSIKLLKR